MSSHYYDSDGNLVNPWTKGALPSPSTILDIIANPGIDAYRARVGEEAADAYMIEAQERGTRIHKACELWLTNDFDYDKAVADAELLAGEELYLNGFVAWWEKYKPELVATEMFLINKKLKYAGRCDLVLRIDGKLWIVDIKTGQTRIKHNLQLKFYQQAYYEMFGERALMGGLYLDAKRSCGYRNSRSEFGMQQYNESLAAIKAHRDVFRWWSTKEPVKQPIDGTLIFKTEETANG